MVVYTVVHTYILAAMVLFYISFGNSVSQGGRLITAGGGGVTSAGWTLRSGLDVLAEKILAAADDSGDGVIQPAELARRSTVHRPYHS